MKAIQIFKYGGADQLRLEEVESPQAKEHEVLVQVHDAGVNPFDWKIREGHMKDAMPARFPLTMGRDFAGLVVDVGAQVHGFAKGESVFGFAEGSYSEYVSARPEQIAHMPETMDYVTAASLPTPGVTAFQLVTKSVNVMAGQTVLIHGAAGGVGSLAVQLAKWKDAEVIATATLEDIPYLQHLGAGRVIDYKTERFDDLVHDVDAVIDLVGGDTLKRSYQVVRPGGVVVSTVGPVNQDEARKKEVRTEAFLMKPNAEDLARLARLIHEGLVKPRISRVLPLADAKKAQELVQEGRAHGKILLQVLQ